MNPLLTKLLCTAVAAGFYVLGHYLPDLKEALLPLAGGLLGGMWMPTPGTVKAPVDSDNKKD